MCVYIYIEREREICIYTHKFGSKTNRKPPVYLGNKIFPSIKCVDRLVIFYGNIRNGRTSTLLDEYIWGKNMTSRTNMFIKWTFSKSWCKGYCQDILHSLIMVYLNPTAIKLPYDLSKVSFFHKLLQMQSIYLCPYLIEGLWNHIHV